MTQSVGEYVPDRGDAIWLEFNPQSGREQAGSRPALVLSPRAYNQRVGLALVCPITNQAKGYPFEVEIPAGQKITGVVLADQVKSLDCVTRKSAFIDTVTATVVMRSLKLAHTLL